MTPQEIKSHLGLPANTPGVVIFEKAVRRWCVGGDTLCDMIQRGEGLIAVTAGQSTIKRALAQRALTSLRELQREMLEDILRASEPPASRKLNSRSVVCADWPDMVSGFPSEDLEFDR